MTTQTVLVVEDDPQQRRVIERMLRRDGLAVVTAGTGAEAIAQAASNDIVVAIVDLLLPDASGLELIGRIREVRPRAECIVLTGMQSDRLAEQARLAGATDYFEKSSMDVNRFLQVVRRAREVQHLKQKLELLEPGQPRVRIIGDSKAMQQVRSLVERMAGASAPVLVTGESGTGKELVAEALHTQSRRRGDFVRINCAALPEALVEAELFGAEEGTFTGQKGARSGLFAAAEHGTLFLDEIGEMPVGLQPKLLRVLQSRRFRPLGSNTERELTARVVAATNVDLKTASTKGLFREDLYYRLAVLTLEMPPLRQRRSDIGLLAAHFVKKFAATEGRPGAYLTNRAVEALERHPWPGNVRELSNSLVRAVVLSRNDEIDAEDLMLGDEPTPSVAAGFEAYMDLPLTEAKSALTDAFCREYVSRKLRAAGGNVTQAATLSGMQRPNFKREMRRLQIEVGD